MLELQTMLILGAALYGTALALRWMIKSRTGRIALNVTALGTASAALAGCSIQTLISDALAEAIKLFVMIAVGIGVTGLIGLVIKYITNNLLDSQASAAQAIGTGIAVLVGVGVALLSRQIVQSVIDWVTNSAGTVGGMPTVPGIGGGGGNSSGGGGNSSGGGGNNGGINPP